MAEHCRVCTQRIFGVGMGAWGRGNCDGRPLVQGRPGRHLAELCHAATVHLVGVWEHLLARWCWRQGGSGRGAVWPLGQDRSTQHEGTLHSWRGCAWGFSSSSSNRASRSGCGASVQHLPSLVPVVSTAAVVHRTPTTTSGAIQQDTGGWYGPPCSVGSSSMGHRTVADVLPGSWRRVAGVGRGTTRYSLGRRSFGGVW